MNYENVVDKMLDAIPELRPLYQKEIEWWDEVLPHIVFGDVLTPFLIELLEKDGQNHIVQRVFKFLEEMANCNDERVQEILGVSILERVGDNPKHLKVASQFMGESTKKISDEIESGWGRK